MEEEAQPCTPDRVLRRNNEVDSCMGDSEAQGLVGGTAIEGDGRGEEEGGAVEEQQVVREGDVEVSVGVKEAEEQEEARSECKEEVDGIPEGPVMTSHTNSNNCSNKSETNGTAVKLELGKEQEQEQEQNNEEDEVSSSSAASKEYDNDETDESDYDHPTSPVLEKESMAIFHAAMEDMKKEGGMEVSKSTPIKATRNVLPKPLQPSHQSGVRSRPSSLERRQVGGGGLLPTTMAAKGGAGVGSGAGGAAAAAAAAAAAGGGARRRGTRVVDMTAPVSDLINQDVKTSSFKDPLMGRLPGTVGANKHMIKSEDIPDWIRKFETVIGHVNQYVLFNELGRGNQGAVYKCLNMENKKIYAIKCLEHASLRRRRRVGSNANSLKNEIQIMKQLDHPNLVKLYDVIDDAEEDKLYLVMDYVEGGNVMGDKDIMSSKDPLSLALEESKARPLFADFVAGMEHLHNYGVLHRDIKPSNLLIEYNTEDGNPRLKVCDFGVSSLCSNDKSAKLLGEDDLVYVGGFGTIAMMSPEALGGGPDNIYHGRPADVWAAGVTLYCMLTGTLPFKGGNMEKMKKQICEDQVSFPSKPKLSKEAKKLILRMLDKDPNTRITMSLIREDPWLQPVYHSRKESMENLLHLSSAHSDPTSSSASDSGMLDKPSQGSIHESTSHESQSFFGSLRNATFKSRSSKRGSTSSSKSPRDSLGNKVGNAFQAMFANGSKSKLFKSQSLNDTNNSNQNPDASK